MGRLGQDQVIGTLQVFAITSIVRFWLISTIIALGAEECVAQQQNKSKRYALLIGVETYGPGITTLTGPIADVRILHTALSKYAGFNEENIHVLSSSEPDAKHHPTRENILHYLSALKTIVPSDGLLLVFFAGHGIERRGRAFILPQGIRMNSDLDYLEDQAVSVDRLKRGLLNIATRQVVVFLDVCRDDPEVSSSTGPNRLTSGFRQPFEDLNKGVSAFLIFYATGPGERAYLSQSAVGFFSKALAEGIAGEARNANQHVTLASLIKYVQEKVPSRVRQEWGPDKNQEPIADNYGFKADDLILSIAGVPISEPPPPPPDKKEPTKPVIPGSQTDLSIFRADQVGEYRRESTTLAGCGKTPVFERNPRPFLCRISWRGGLTCD